MAAPGRELTSNRSSTHPLWKSYSTM